MVVFLKDAFAMFNVDPAHNDTIKDIYAMTVLQCAGLVPSQQEMHEAIIKHRQITTGSLPLHIVV